MIGRVKLGACAIVAASLAPFLSVSEAAAWDLKVCADSTAPPFSTEAGTGFENRIAEIIADELGATVSYIWVPENRIVTYNFLREGDCDLVMGAADGTAAVLATIAYYRSPYVFVQRADEDYVVATFDDAILHDLNIGVMPSDSPAHHALLRRGLDENIILETLDLVIGRADPFESIVAALVDGTIDVAVVWGPPGGYQANRQETDLIITPVPPFEPPFIPMFINMVAGVRHGDEFLRDMVDVAIVNRWEDIQAVLDDMDIPRMDLVPPALTLDDPR